jgi:hypothetical protein
VLDPYLLPPSARPARSDLGSASAVPVVQARPDASEKAPAGRTDGGLIQGVVRQEGLEPSAF